MEDISNCKSLSDIARILFGKENYTNREKVKKYLSDNGIDWKEWLKEQNEKPKRYCKNCGKELIEGDYRKVFCSHSCAASFNNKGVVRNGVEKNKYCICCGKELKPSQRKYCSYKCQRNFNYKEYIKNWKEGIENGNSGKYGISGYIRRYLFEQYNCKCEKCGWGEVNPTTGKTPLQIHHIDGDCTNNSENNLQLLCPNCHSLTENFGSLNENATRVDDRKRW